MKKLTIILVAGAFALMAGCGNKDKVTAVGGVEAAPPVPDHVAVVNGVKVPRTLFDEEIAKVTQNGLRKIPEDRLLKVRDGIVNRLIEEELLAQAVKANDIVVTPEEIEAQFQEYKSRFKGDEQFDNYLKHGKVTVEVIKERLAKTYSMTKLLEKLGKVNITDEEIRNAYTAGLKMFTEHEQVRASHILVRLAENADAAVEKEARAKIDQALARLKKGEDFGEVAKSMSEDATTAPKGGDLGMFKAGTMVPAFEKAAFALEPGKYTKDAVRTPFGLHIIIVFEKQPERVKPFEEVQDKITLSLKNKAIFKARRELVRELRASAKIEKLEGDTSATGMEEKPAARAPEGQPVPPPAPVQPPAPAPEPAVQPAAPAPAEPAAQAGN